MSVASLPSERAGGRLEALHRLRVTGGVEIGIGADGRVRKVGEADGYRVRFPRVGGHCEAVLLNTGGGVAGGDRVRFAVELDVSADATVTTVAAERIYRAAGPPAALAVTLRLGAGATLAWLPQETILYDGSRLERAVEVDLDRDSVLTFADILVLGRTGSGERLNSGTLADRWLIRRAGRLVHWEALRLDGDVAGRLLRPATADGQHVIATLVHVASDAADRLAPVRAALEPHQDVEIAASAWNGKLVVRALGRCSNRVRRSLSAAVEALTGRPMPRVWQL